MSSCTNSDLCAIPGIARVHSVERERERERESCAREFYLKNPTPNGSRPSGLIGLDRKGQKNKNKRPQPAKESSTRRGRVSRQRYAQRPPSSSRPTGMSSFPRHVGAASLKDKVSSDSATGICPGVAHREPLHPRKGNGPMDHSLGARKQRSD